VPTKRTRAEPEEGTRQRIEQAAIRVFAAHGFSGTGIREIAHEAGLSLSTLYYYSPTKQDLLSQIMTHALDDLITPAQRISDEIQDAVDRMRALVSLHVREHATNSLRSIVSDSELRALTLPQRKRVMEKRDEYEGIWRKAIEAGVEEGAFVVPDVGVTTLAVLEMCTGLAHWYRPTGRLSIETLANHFERLVLNALGLAQPDQP
jgi:AcrR family transcriptional regulator